METAPSSRLRTLLPVAITVLVAAGLVMMPASRWMMVLASDSPEPDFVFQGLDDGVHEVLEDGAGHELAKLHDFRGSPRLALDAEGTPWLHWHGSERLIELGTPGTFRHVIGPGTIDVQFEADGRMWVRNGDIATYGPDGWVVHPDQMRRTANGTVVGASPKQTTIHPHGGVVTAWRSWEAAGFKVLGAEGPGSTNEFAAPLLLDHDWEWSPRMAVTPDAQVWLLDSRWKSGRDGYTRPPSRLLRSDGGAWETIDPLGQGVAAEPVGMPTTRDGALIVHLLESAVESTGLDSPYARDSYGAGEWLARRDPSGIWTVFASGDDPGFVEDGWLVAATDEAVWLSVWDVDCAGLMEVREQGARMIIEGFCPSMAPVDGFERIWAVGTHDGKPKLYVITPQAAAGRASLPGGLAIGPRP